MRITLLILLIIGSIQFAYSQYNPDNDDEPKIKRYYKLSDFSAHYSGAIFDFSSSYLTHMHEINSFQTPSWTNMDSTIQHSNRSEIYTRLNFQKQLIDSESSFYGNFAVGLSIGTGHRLDASYSSDEKISYDTAIFNSDPVTELDTITILQNEYRYSATEIGIDLLYTVSTSSKPTLRGELGLGVTALYTITDNFRFVKSESVNISFIDQFNRMRTFNELNRETTELSTTPQMIFKLYMPLILSYKLNHRGNFALSTMISGGVEFQKPQNGNIYTYPYFTIGIGFKYYF